MNSERPSATARYGLALAITGLALLGTFVAEPFRDKSPFLLSIVAVTITVWYGGLGPGLLSTALAGLGIAFLLFPPPAGLQTSESLLHLSAFILAAFLITSLNEARLRRQEAIRRFNETLERKVSERTMALEAKNQALQQSEEALRRQAGELSRSNADLERFAYVASHDLQEPLRMVASYVQLLARRYKGKLDADADAFIGYAVDGVQRMQRLIKDLLAYARLGAGEKVFRATDCETVFAHALANLQDAIETSRAALTHDPLPTVMADETQMVQLFQNLIGNALKFHGDERPRIHVSATRRMRPEETRGEWIFSVQDNGIGVEPQYRERIFEVFERLHDAGSYSGTGIGLAICRKIVEGHGGRIWVESGPGAGATFYFTIPDAG